MSDICTCILLLGNTFALMKNKMKNIFKNNYISLKKRFWGGSLGEGRCSFRHCMCSLLFSCFVICKEGFFSVILKGYIYKAPVSR